MKNRITKLLALLMAAAIVFSLAACGKDADETTTAASETTTQGDTTAAAETTAAGETTAAPGDTTAAGETTAAAGVTKPETKEQILAAYTAVMNKAKTDKPGFTKYEYQELPINEANFEDGKVIERLLPLADLFMTKEDKAKSNASVLAKGNDMNELPVKGSPNGCMVSDPAAVKSAKCDVLPDGNYKIVIVLNSETNPEPLKDGQAKAASNHGNMFTTPLGKSAIDKELQSNTAVKFVIKTANYSLQYRDGTTTLVYNPKTSQVISLDQYMKIDITMSGKIIVIGEAAGTAVLKMYYKAYSFKY